MNKSLYNDLYSISWAACVITLPWAISVNNFLLIVLAVVSIAEGNFELKWRRLKDSKQWLWPFLLFFFVHVVGVLYSSNSAAGFFEVEKKLPFLILPLVAASGPSLSVNWIERIKWAFIFSCLTMVVISLGLTCFLLISGDIHAPLNFDAQSSEAFNKLNPEAGYAWEYFSYIQLGQWIDIHPAYFSMYLVFCIAILTEKQFQKGKIDILLSIIIGLFTLFIVLLSSRMAVIALAVIVIYISLTAVKWKINFKAFTAAGFIILSFCGLIWIDPVARFRIFQEPINTPLQIDTSIRVWNSVSLRLLEWEASTDAMKTSWLTGVGSGDGQDALKTYYGRFQLSPAALTYNAHSQYLQTALELGVAGVFALLVCFILPIFRPNVQPIHIAFVLLFAMMCLTESMLARQKGIVFFTLFQSLFLRSKDPLC